MWLFQVCVCVCVCAHRCVSEDNLGYHPQEFCSSVLRQALLLAWNSSIRLSWLDNDAQIPSCLFNFSTRVVSIHHCFHQFHMSAGNQTQDLTLNRQTLQMLSYPSQAKVCFQFYLKIYLLSRTEKVQQAPRIGAFPKSGKF